MLEHAVERKRAVDCLRSAAGAKVAPAGDSGGQMKLRVAPGGDSHKRGARIRRARNTAIFRCSLPLRSGAEDGDGEVLEHAIQRKRAVDGLYAAAGENVAPAGWGSGGQAKLRVAPGGDAGWEPQDG